MMGMPSCREAARGLAEGSLAELPRPRRFLVRMHLLVCRHCRRFARELDLIARGLRTAWEGRPSPSEELEARERILARLRKL